MRLRAAATAGMLAVAAAAARAGIETVPALDPRPRPVAWVEPRALSLPSAEALDTTVVSGRTFRIARVSPAAALDARRRRLAAQGAAPEGFDPVRAAGFHAAADEALSFTGSGGGGLRSRERLVVEDCAFVLDFEEGDFETWDARRSAIYVEGYREVLVRRCVFVSKALPSDPMRKVTASICAYDCANVQVEDCYFEGRTVGFRGHVLVFCSGPTSIRNCEIDARGGVAGGIWVATGVGEGKIGYLHADEPELTIYPPGPLLVENCWVHDQRGKENADGIYIQSVRPYLVRNCKVENWQEDSLVDVGFRDTTRPFGGAFLPNHGGLGVIEHCEFAGGYVKDSVGLGGGLVFRNNRLRNAWLFPYAFDGGSWFAVGNLFDPMARVVLSGRNGQTDGWTPGEGMIARGGRFHFFNNLVASSGNPAALFVGGARPAPLKAVVASDYNVYALAPAPPVWAIEVDGSKLTLEQWREQTGNDKHSIVGEGDLTAFAGTDPGTLALPGGTPMRFGAVKAGLTGPVGVSNPAVLARAKALSAEAEAERARAAFAREAENLSVSDATLDVKKETRAWSGGVGWLVLTGRAPGEKATFTAEVPHAGRYYVETASMAIGQGGRYRLTVDGRPLGEAVALDAKGAQRHGAFEFSAGPHAFTYTFEASGPAGGGAAAIDAIRFCDAARARAASEKAAAARAAAAAVEAARLKYEVSALPVADKGHGRLSDAVVKGQAYRLWMPAATGDVVAFTIEVADAGRYEVGLRTFQQADRAQVVAEVDGRPVGAARPLAGAVVFGEAELSAGRHAVGLRLVSPSPPEGGLKLRLLRLDLLPRPALPPAPGPAEAPTVTPPEPAA